MNRRTLLTGGVLLVVLLAGCTYPVSSVLMEPVSDDRELAELASRSTALNDTDVTSEMRRQRRLVRAAIENGSVTAEGLTSPVTDGLPFAYRGTYYEISRSIVDRQMATQVSITELANNTSTESADSIAYEDLPTRDQEALARVLPPSPPNEWDAVSASTVYTDAERARSVLIPEQRYVIIYNGERYHITVDHEPVQLTTYRYTATQIAAGPSAYAQQLQNEYLFTLSGLSTAERKIVEAAIEEDGAYNVERGENETFWGVVERFKNHAAIQQFDDRYDDDANEEGGIWIVRYNGEIYIAKLYYPYFPASTETASDVRTMRTGR